MNTMFFDQLNFKKLYFRDRCFDKVALENAINHLACHLQKNLVSSSPVVLLTAYNHIKTIIAYYAILRTGKAVAILDPEWRDLEVSEVIADLDPAAIFFLNNTTNNLNYQEEIVFRNNTPGFEINTDISEVCTLAYTNAEDGFAKAAMLTNKNMMTEVEAIIRANRLDHQSVIYSLLPFSHLYGMVLGILVSTKCGGSAVISELNMLRINDNLQEMVTYRATHFYSVPSVYYVLSKCEGVRDVFRQVKMCISGGTKLKPFIFDSFYKKTNLAIHEGYGLTETSPACTFNFEDDEVNVESIGKPLAGSDIRVFDENMKECLPDQIGEICIRGDLVFKGYFNHAAATRHIFRDGWLHTGDLGKKDRDGYVYFYGLKKPMINVAGVKVFPKKLERLFKTNCNVIEAKITSDESLLQGQVVKSQVWLKETTEQAQQLFKQWCFEHINNLTLPRAWCFE